MTPQPTASVRERILHAAAQLLADGGQDAASTRAVSAAAGVQAPTIYRLFGDKQGLLDAVAVEALESYLAAKTRRPSLGDPVEDLRAGWDEHVAFGLAHPEVYALLERQGPHTDPPPAALAAAAVLRERIHRVAAVGRLRLPEELAAHLMQAVGRGVVSSLIATPEAQRDPRLSSTAREAVIACLTGAAAEPAPSDRVTAAITLLANLDETHELTSAERALLNEWLRRIADGAASDG